MDYHSVFLELKSQFPDLQIFENHSPAPYTTIRIGGPADIFIHSTTPNQFISILNFVHQEQLPITILGNGSNVLIADSGIRGLVVKNSSQDIQIIDTPPVPITFHHTYTQRMENEPDKYLDFTKIDYDESGKPQLLVKISSGTPLPYTINYLLDQGVTGLQWFAYIPGTVGGATWYNIHGGAYHFSDYLESIDAFDTKSGQIVTFLKSDLAWKYEKSFFQDNPNLVITSTTLRLFRGDSDLAKKVKQAWIAQKAKVQPMNSAGSIFANPSLKNCQKIWGEQKSTGWIIDHQLGLKGHQIGGAQISLQHANFIVNTGKATADDVLSLVKLVQSQIQQKSSLILEPEIRLLGFAR